MKNKTIVFLAMCAILILAGCNKKTNGTATTNDTIEVNTGEVMTETPISESKTIEGTVKAINHGKDGYTAELETAEGIYFVTISHSNLTDHQQYRDVKIGDKLKVTGDFWVMEDKNQITVRVIE